MHPSTLFRRFGTLVRQTSLPEIRLHDLRHTFATLALQASVPVKAVSEILGHVSVTITYDTYSHVIPDMAGGPLALASHRQAFTRSDLLIYRVGGGT